MKGGTGACVRGVTGGRIPITHTAMSDRIGKVNIVPGASENLLSVSTLMKTGCEMGAKGEHLWIKDKDGNTKLTAKMNEKGLYAVRWSTIRRAVDNSSSKVRVRGWESSAGSKWRGGVRQTDSDADRVIKANLADGGSLQWDSSGVCMLNSSGARVPGKEETERDIYMSIVDECSMRDSDVMGLSGGIEEMQEDVRVNRKEITFTAEERDRAMRAREAHNKQGHPSSDVLVKALDNGVYEGMGGAYRERC